MPVGSMQERQSFQQKWSGSGATGHYRQAREPRPFQSQTPVNSQWVVNLNVKGTTRRLLEKNVGETL